MRKMMGRMMMTKMKKMIMMMTRRTTMTMKTMMGKGNMRMTQDLEDLMDTDYSSSVKDLIK